MLNEVELNVKRVQTRPLGLLSPFVSSSTEPPYLSVSMSVDTWSDASARMSSYGLVVGSAHDNNEHI